MSATPDPAFLSAPAEGAERLVATSWVPVLTVTALAALLRLLLYPGFFGSDEVTYVESAFKLLHGDWTVDRYVGANRYGVNLPVAAFGWLFGQAEFAAALYSMLCSVGEVALVTWIGIRMFGTRAGWSAGLLLASLPLHVSYAGRLMADAPLGLAITGSFVMFYVAETRYSRWAYLAAGAAAGWSFWIKPAAIFYVVVLLLYPAVFRRFRRDWAWTVLGFVVLVLANNLLFWWLTGKFWFLFEALGERRASGYLEEGTSSGTIANAAEYYFVYLFWKVYHTWLVGYLALAASVWWLARRRSHDPDPDFAFRFALWWAAGMLILMSLLVVSLRPVTLVPKQANYMLMFMAPLCLLAGVALARLRGAAFGLALLFTVGPALVLALLQQASIQVFTSNSKATVKFARSHQGAQIFVTTNALRAAEFDALVHPVSPKVKFEGLDRLLSDRAPSTGERFAIIDTETLGWGEREPIRRIGEVPGCWQRLSELTPIGLGAGPAAARVASSFAASLPRVASIRVQALLAHLAAPAPAFVYRVPDQPCEPVASRS